MESYKEKMGDTISAINRRIDQLKVDLKKVGNEAKNDYNKTIADLEQKGKQLKNKFDDYQSAGEEKWKEFKTDLSEDIDTLSKQVKDLSSRKSR